nr:MAG TPA: hypothetical protein [Caudoviricetes sp.]
MNNKKGWHFCASRDIIIFGKRYFIFPTNIPP